MQIQLFVYVFQIILSLIHHLKNNVNNNNFSLVIVEFIMFSTVVIGYPSGTGCSAGGSRSGSGARIAFFGATFWPARRGAT